MDHDACYDHLSGKPDTVIIEEKINNVSIISLFQVNAVCLLQVKNLSAITGQNGTPVAGAGNSSLGKSKRNRPLLRQERVRKEIEKDNQALSENDRSSPTVSTFQHILPKY